MKIRCCPNCVELIHFETDSPIQRCWNCGRVTNFDLLKNPVQRLALWLLTLPEAALQKAALPSSHVKTVGKTVLVVGIPVVVTMLLVSNCFNIHIVHDLTAPFSMP